MAMAIGSAAGATLQAASTGQSFTVSPRWAPLKNFTEPRCRCKTRKAVVAQYRRESGSGDFLAGFVLGGVVFGALGYLLAPQVNRSYSEKENWLLRKPKPSRYVDEEEEGIEKTRMGLNEKIAQLNSAIDDISAQLKTNEGSGKTIQEVEVGA